MARDRNVSHSLVMARTQEARRHMALERWDPFQEMLTLREAMDRLFQESFVRPTSAMVTAGRGAIPLDVAETDNDYIVRATVPGVSPEDIQISVQGDTLTITCESKGSEEQTGQNWLIRERRAATYRRSVTLPMPVNANQSEANYENGILTLKLPKAEEARPKQIKLGGAGAQAQIPGGQQGGGQGRMDTVNQQSAQSFPASDAPSWTPER